MTKKSFTGGLNSLLTSTVTSNEPINPTATLGSGTTLKPGLKQAQKRRPGKNLTAYQAVRDGAKKITFIVKEDLCNKIKALAYYERLPIGRMVENIFEEYLSKRDPETIEKIIKAFKKKPF